MDGSERVFIGARLDQNAEKVVLGDAARRDRP